MDWGQVSAFAGVVVIVGAAQVAYMKGYVDKVTAELRTEIATLRAELVDRFGAVEGRLARVEVRIEQLDRDVQAIATKAHDH